MTHKTCHSKYISFSLKQRSRTKTAPGFQRQGTNDSMLEVHGVIWTDAAKNKVRVQVQDLGRCFLLGLNNLPRNDFFKYFSLVM